MGSVRVRRAPWVNPRLSPALSDGGEKIGWKGRCLYCGGPLFTPRSDTKYCGDSCRVMACRHRKKEKEKVQ